MRWLLFPLAVVVCLEGAAPAAPGWTEVDRVAVVVNQDVILASEVDRRINGYKASMKTPPKPEQLEQVRAAAVRDLTDELLIIQAATQARLEVSDAEVGAALDQIKQQNKLDDAGFERALAQNGYTLEYYREDVRHQILRLKALNVVVRPRVVVADRQVRDAYMAEKATNPKLGAFAAEEMRLKQQVFEQQMSAETEKWLAEQHAASFIEVRP